MGEIRSMAGQNLYLAREADPGTAETTGYFGAPGLRAKPGWDGDREVFRGGGGKVPTATLGTDEVSPWDMSVANCFNHIGLVLASRFGIPTTTTPGGGTNSRQHVFTINPTAEDLARFYSAIWGDGYLTVQGIYGYFNSLSLDISRGDVSIDTSFRSRAGQIGAGSLLPGNEVQTVTITGVPDGGSFTLTLPFLSGGSGTTAAIDFDATADEVKAAIVAITGEKIGATEVSVTGGPGPDTPWVVTFHGRYAQQNIAAMTTTDSLTGGTAPASAVTETNAGAAPTNMAIAPMPSNMWDMYLDDSWGDLGTTHYGGAYNMKLDFGDKNDEDMPINSSLISYEQPIEKEEQDYTFETTIRLGETARAQVSNLAAGTTQFVRAQLSTAPVGAPNPYYIEGTIPYSLTFDMGIQLTSRSTVDTAPNSSAVVLPLSAVMVPDESAHFVTCTLVNTITAY